MPDVKSWDQIKPLPGKQINLNKGSLRKHVLENTEHKELVEAVEAKVKARGGLYAYMTKKSVDAQGGGGGGQEGGGEGEKENENENENENEKEKEKEKVRGGGSNSSRHKSLMPVVGTPWRLRGSFWRGSIDVLDFNPQRREGVEASPPRHAPS